MENKVKLVGILDIDIIDSTEYGTPVYFYNKDLPAALQSENQKVQEQQQAVSATENHDEWVKFCENQDAKPPIRVNFRVYYNQKENNDYAKDIWCFDIPDNTDYTGQIRRWFNDGTGSIMGIRDELFEIRYGDPGLLDFQITVPTELAGQNFQGREVLFNVLFKNDELKVTNVRLIEDE